MDARMMERDKVMDEPVALRLTQLNPAPPTPPHRHRHPKIHPELLAFLQETSRWTFSPICVANSSSPSAQFITVYVGKSV